MKNLLYKELKLTANFQIYIYCILCATIVIPSYPSLTAFLYPLAGFTVAFTLSGANRDLLYTAILPIRKRDIVNAKVLLISFLEIVTMLVSVPFGFLRNFFINLSVANGETPLTDLGFNIALYGILFVIFGIFNLIIFPWYYKKPENKNFWPFIIGDIICAILIVLTMCAFMLFSSATEYLNTFAFPNVLVQLGILLGGFLIFTGANFLAAKLGGKSFQKVDI